MAMPQGRFRVVKTDAEWKRALPPLSYEILRHEATERPFSNPLNNEHRAGIFRCLGCDWPLYNAKDKFESGTGWPSFTRPINNQAVGYLRDTSMLMVRTAVFCASCGGHLGHVFDDGPPPTGKRFCMNGAAMRFQPA